MSERTRRVLLVDDEEELVGHLVKRLRGRGFLVVGVTSGDEALEVAAGAPFDVAVVDLKMPGKGGLETLEGLKRLQPMLEVLMLTGYGSMSSAFESGRLLASKFLTKPLAFDDLLSEIEVAYAAKRAALRSAFQRERDALDARGCSPKELLEAVARLREEYEQ